MAVNPLLPEQLYDLSSNRANEMFKKTVKICRMLHKKNIDDISITLGFLKTLAK